MENSDFPSESSSKIRKSVLKSIDITQYTCKNDFIFYSFLDFSKQILKHTAYRKKRKDFFYSIFNSTDKNPSSNNLNVYKIVFQKCLLKHLFFLSFLYMCSFNYYSTYTHLDYDTHLYLLYKNVLFFAAKDSL